ncbi:hypothetical protein HSIEG1_79 [Enterococcus sp. HSIEG1]|nr:hypothetical protein HSIEG1_79 [Enterococcus sp. HSIEG1]
MQKILTGEFAVRSQSTVGLGTAFILLFLWGVGAVTFLLIADKKNWLAKGVI